MINSNDIKKRLPDTISKLDKLLRLSDTALMKNARVFATEQSKMRMPFSDDKSLDKSDLIAMLRNIPIIISTMGSYFKSNRMDKNMIHTEKNTMSRSDFSDMVSVLDQCDTASFGYVNIEPKHIFSDLGVPYKNAIVISAPQDNDIIKTSPSADSQMEVMRVYGVTGIAANRVSRYLNSRGYAGVPGHSLGGSIDYCQLGMEANMGMIGKHGMLITPECGANHRMSVVYTNIENLDEFIKNDDDHSWIKDFCTKCSKCVRKCPGSAILKENDQDEHGNIKSIDYFKCIGHFASDHGCNVCIKECPFTTVGYEKLNESFEKTRDKNRQH